MKIISLQERSTRLFFPILLSLAFIVFWRGHQLPGGGFIAGLIAATAMMLRNTSKNENDSNIDMATYLRYGLPAGLGMALCAALMSLLIDKPLFTGLWLPELSLPFLKVHLGTPFLFDLGVFVTVSTFCISTVQYYREME